MKKVSVISFSLFFAFILLLFFSTDVKAISQSQTYLNGLKGQTVDVALFWGQSNMVGKAGKYDNEKKADPNKKALTGIIDTEILNVYKAMNYVSVPVKAGTAFEYKINSKGGGYIAQIDSSTKTLGQALTYDAKKGLHVYDKDGGDTYWSLAKSSGTNMIPQFCKTYYERTGRKLIVVLAAKGGEEIATFLPNQAEHNYEALVAKYKGAISLLEKNKVKIGNKFYVCFQGCADATAKLANKASYMNKFKTVHNNIINNLGIKFGAIVEVAGRVSKTKAQVTYFKAIHDAQEALIKNNSNIILGSDFAWRMCQDKKTIAFCPTTPINNSTHLTSASLSQVGKETAISVVKYLKTK